MLRAGPFVRLRRPAADRRADGDDRAVSLVKRTSKATFENVVFCDDDEILGCCSSR